MILPLLGHLSLRMVRHELFEGRLGLVEGVVGVEVQDAEPEESFRVVGVARVRL